MALTNTAAVCTLGMVLAHLWITPGLSCPYKAKAAVESIFDSKVDTLTKPACFSIEAMRTLGDTEGIYDTLGNQLSGDTCKKLCKERGHDGRIVSVTPTECHCNKNFLKKGLVDLSKCSKPCPGDGKQKCGDGDSFISAYPN